MKYLLISVLLAMTPSMVVADNIFGIWQTTKDSNGNYGHIKVEQCGETICGKLIKSFKSDGSIGSQDNIGRNIVSKLKNRGNGKYTGKVYSPDANKTYKSKLNLKGNKLSVRGCIGPICRNGGTWVRLN